MEYKKRYLVNIRTKNIHDTLNIKPICKVNIFKIPNYIEICPLGAICLISVKICFCMYYSLCIKENTF